MTNATVQLADVARRVLAYVRGRQLLSNVDREEISEVTVMPHGAGEPMTFTLLSSDLEALAMPHLRSAERAEEELQTLVRTAIVEEGWTCKHTNEDGPAIVVDVDGVTSAIVAALRKAGAL